MGVALHFSLQLVNHKSQRSDVGAVCKANNGVAISLSLAEFIDEKKELPFQKELRFFCV